MDTPELTSVEAFVEYLLDDDRTQVTYQETEELAQALGQSVPTNVIHELQQYGIQVGERAIAKRVRGFRTSSHDRFFGPGSSPMHGGSGWEQISGFAGQKG
jgi:hypothetical protein